MLTNISKSCIMHHWNIGLLKINRGAHYASYRCDFLLPLLVLRCITGGGDDPLHTNLCNLRFNLQAGLLVARLIQHLPLRGERGNRHAPSHEVQGACLTAPPASTWGGVTLSASGNFPLALLARS